MTAPDNFPAAPRYSLADRCRALGWYYPAAILLLILAAALRFYDLAGNTIYHDEAVASFYTRGTFSQLLDNTRANNASAIAYLLLLFLVQKVEISPLSIRLVPAIASLLTVAALLFLLPRVGLSRPAAFLAALLLTLSTAAIEYAQYAREYSLDTLLAALLIAGFLSYLRNGSKALLGAALFLAPLVQWGLALFCAAVLAAALLTRNAGDSPSLPKYLNRTGANPWLARLGERLKSRRDLILPAALFLTGSLISYLTALRYIWAGDGYTGDYARHLYGGGYDPLSILSFVASHSWLMLTYLLPAAVALLALTAFAFLSVASLKKRSLDPIALLLLLSIATGIVAALLQLYPLGNSRHSLYLAPIIFLAAGVALCWAASQLATLTRRPWLRLALLTALTALAALTGAAAIRQDNPWRDWSQLQSVIALLDEPAQAGDLICVSKWYTPTVEFYQGKPANYRYRCSRGLIAAQGGFPGILNTAPSGRLWLVSGSPSDHDTVWDALRSDGPSKIEHIIYGEPHLYRISRPSSPDLLSEYQSTRAQPPAARATFDLYLDFDLFRNKSRLRYLKEPCAPSDTAARFFLQITPADPADLPLRQQPSGVDRQDFDFARHGAVFAGKCMATVPLPDYPVAAIRTGQLTPGQEPVWTAEFPADTAQLWHRIYQSIAAGEPAARAAFNLYIRDNYLHYLKEPCHPADTAAPFFLHLVPANTNDLPQQRRLYGFANRDFDFALRGTLQDGRCLTAVPLPDYPIAEIRTGQYSGSNRLWETVFAVAR